MKNREDTLGLAEQLIEPFVIPHVPEGTEPRALIDQWLHAIATDNQL